MSNSTKSTLTKKELSAKEIQQKYERVILLGKENIPKRIYKYVTLENLIKDVKGFDKIPPSLMFAEPNTWHDPFESLLYNAFFEGVGSLETPRVYACCVTVQQASEASWVTYGYGGTGLSSRCAKIVIKTDSFLKQLNNYAKENGYNVYIGRAKYECSKDIKELSVGSPILTKCMPNKHFTKETFLNLLCLKRDYFSYEKEIRFFFVSDKYLPRTVLKKKNVDDRIFVPINWLEVAKIIYIDDKCSKVELDIISKIVNEIGVKKSTLYSKVKEKLIIKIK